MIQSGFKGYLRKLMPPSHYSLLVVLVTVNLEFHQ
jgi:hypothetical protein